MEKITHAYLDLDSVPYVGANIAEKPVYQWFKNCGTEQSKPFAKAKDAKEWMEAEIGFNEGNPDDWTRKKVMHLREFKVCVKGMDNDLNGWIRSIKKLTKNDDITLVGMLTCSGIKNKDLPHLEDRYQFNRYESRTPKNLPEGHDKYTAPWVGLKKPTHLKEARTYLMTTLSYCKMSPPKIEADAPLVYFAERKGYHAVCCSKDKDLKQLMRSNFIDMNPKEKDRVLLRTSLLGEVHMEYNAKGDGTLRGSGFKLIMAQTLMGDSSDGYKGIKGWGDKGACELLIDLETIKECCLAVLDVYTKKFPKGHKYTDWQGNKQDVGYLDLAIQHCNLAYHERGGKDVTNPLERFIMGLPPVYNHNGKLEE